LGGYCQTSVFWEPFQSRSLCASRLPCNCQLKLQCWITLLRLGDDLPLLPLSRRGGGNATGSASPRGQSPGASKPGPCLGTSWWHRRRRHRCRAGGTAAARVAGAGCGHGPRRGQGDGVVAACHCLRRGADGAVAFGVMGIVFALFLPLSSWQLVLLCLF